MPKETSLKGNFKHGIQNFLKNESTPVFLVFLTIIIVITIIQPKFLSFLNIKNVILQNSITGMIALGMTFVMISGGIDLSVGFFMSFLGCTMAYLYVTWQLPTYLVVIIIIILAIAGSGLMGFIISRTKVESFIVSLGFMTVYQGFTYLVSKSSQVNIGEDKFKFLGSKILDVGVAAWLFIILTVLLGLVLQYTRYGKRAYAVGGNEKAAYLAGINVKNHALSVYILNGLLVALGAMATVSRLSASNPLMGQGKEIEAIAAVVVGGTALSGGKGKIVGTLMGVLLLGILSNGMNIIGIDPYWKYIVTGIVIVGAVVGSHYSRFRGSKGSTLKSIQ
jgi:ribose/xylose/arabinose/galactoside ABC-type transport system permease subunit